jgi:lipopolysaccharide/colanic/teichoic acid biosynthesis glycosyltransferase
LIHLTEGWEISAPLLEVARWLPGKRFFDTLLTLVTAPLWMLMGLLVAVYVKLMDPGFSIFRQERVGLNGRVFTMYKFRTMDLDAEKDGAQFASEQDPRFIRGGSFLRKSRLDEIPQLWNVLKGDMSLVGPRAEQVPFVEDFHRMIPFYDHRNMVRPGITGWAQVNYGYADDQVETVLLRLIRGTGLTGLKGMLPIRQGGVIRPLLEVWRRDIESFALEKRIPFVLDSSNLKEDYLRNKLRLSLIPLIEKEYQPNLKEVIFKTSSVLREENDTLEQIAEENYHAFVRNEKKGLVFKFQEYQSLHPAIQWRVLQKVMGKTYRDQMEMEEEGPAIGRIYEKLRHPPAAFYGSTNGIL